MHAYIHTSLHPYIHTHGMYMCVCDIHMHTYTYMRMRAYTHASMTHKHICLKGGASPIYIYMGIYAAHHPYISIRIYA